MPYISTEDVKEIRKRIRKTLPNFKVSVRKRDCMGVDVLLISGDVDFGSEYSSINHFHYKETYEDNQDAVKIIDKIMASIHFTKPTKIIVHDGDYGSIPNFYINLRIGDYNKPYKFTG